MLGFLPADVKQTIQDISARANERLQAYLDARRQAGKPTDAAEIARLRQQTRDETDDAEPGETHSARSLVCAPRRNNRLRANYSSSMMVTPR